MDICQWNVGKVDGEPFGTAKYEDKISEKRLNESRLSISRIQRSKSGFRSTMPVSWLLRYRCRSSDLVHATFQTVAPAAFVHRPDNFVVTVHDLAPLVYPSEIRDASLYLQWQLTPKALKLADKIIAISNYTKREIEHLTDIGSSRIEVIHQGIDHDKYKPLPKQEARRRLGITPEDTFVLVVSSSLEHKRVEEAKPIIEAVREENPGVKLLKAGYGEELTGEYVVNTGWVDEEDMPALYSAADVYLHPSEYEGFGLPVLEAMACGTPVVARDVASIPEIVGDCFDLVSPDATPKEFAEAIASSLEIDSPYNDAVERSEHFSWEKTTRETVDVYRSLLQ